VGLNASGALPLVVNGRSRRRRNERSSMNRLTLSYWCGALSPALGLIAAACGSGEERQQAATATATSLATATAPAASPTAPAGERRTGIEDVDRVIQAILSDDIEALRAVTGYVQVACTLTQEGIGAPPLCREGEPEGTLVDVFQGAQCEGFYMRPDEMQTSLESIARSPNTLYAVYRTRSDDWPEGKYVAIFETDVLDRPELDAVAATIAGGRMVGFHFGCAMTPEQFVEFFRVTDFVLPPESP
jgi:hypothetical protein